MGRRLLLPALAACILVLQSDEPRGQSESKDQTAPADAATAAATPVEQGIIVVVYEIKEEEKTRDDLAKKVDKLPAAEKTLANDQLKWAGQQMEFAAKELARARNEKNEAVRQVYLKEAMDKVEMARSYTRRVEASVGLPPRDDPRYVGVAGPSRGGIQPGESTAYQQLRKAAVLSKDEKTGAAFGERDTGRLAELKDYDQRTQTATLPNGQKINVGAVQRAVDKLTGTPKPVFERVEVPGRPPVWRLTPAARATLHDPAKRPAVDEVGGVALKVTFDVLSFAGVSDFRPRGPATVVQKPVLISLRKLLERADAILRTPADWDRLADELRFPGGIDRIHGFVIMPGAQDLMLVGAVAADPANRISLDLLIVALQAVWKDGKDPAVSLDKRPGDKSLVRYARVENIPFQSRFAKLMLEADYAMKHIDRLVWGRRLGQYSVKSLAIDREEQPKLKDDGFPRERQWLSPAPLSPSDLHVSASGRSLLFSASVQRQSESYVTKAALLEIVERMLERQNALFNQFYPSFETSPEIEPRGIFRRMRGLVDLVTLSILLREAGVDAAVLERLAKLPLPALKGPQAVPSTFTSFFIDHPEFPVSINTGGARLRIRPRARHFDLVDAAAVRLLEQAADRFARAPGVAAILEASFSIPQSTSFPEFIIDRRISEAESDAEAGRLEQAADKLSEVTRLAPFDARGWAHLGRVEAKRKRVAESNQAVAKALSLAPTDPEVKNLIVLATLDRGGQTSADWPEQIRFEVAYDYVIRARERLARGNLRGANDAALLALDLRPDYGEAALLLAMSAEDPLSDRAQRARTNAIALFRKAVAANPTDDNRRDLAFALAISVAWQMEAMVKAVPRYAQMQDSADLRRKLFRQTYGLLEEAEEAEKNDPSHPLAPAIRPRLLMLQQMLAQLAGLPGNFGEALHAAESAVARFPGFAEAHLSHAQILLQIGQPGEASRALYNAITLDPGFANALVLRASLYAQHGHCKFAHDDLARARKAGGEIHPDVATFVRGFCP